MPVTRAVCSVSRYEADAPLCGKYPAEIFYLAETAEICVLGVADEEAAAGSIVQAIKCNTDFIPVHAVFVLVWGIYKALLTCSTIFPISL